MKRMEVPRLPLHNLQACSGAVTPDSVKQNKTGKIQKTPETRVLRNGKRVPTGTASKTAPQTQGKGSRLNISDTFSQAPNVPEVQDAAENAETAKVSIQTAAVPRSNASPLSQLPVNKQIFTSPQPSSVSKPAQRYSPVTEAPSQHTSDQNRAQSGSSQAPAAASPAPRFGISPEASAAAVDTVLPITAQQQSPQPRMSSTPILCASSVHTPTASLQTPPKTLSPSPVSPSDSVTSPPAFTAASKHADTPATPTLFPAASRHTPVAPHPTPAVGLGASRELMQPILSHQPSPDAVMSSLQNLNLQSRPFDFADDTDSGDPSLLAEPAEANVSVADHVQLSSPEQDLPEQAVPADTEQGHRAVVGDTQAQGASEAVEQEGEEQEDSVPINYVSRRTTDPYMQKKLRGLQKEEWSEADGTFKMHKSKIQLAKEQAAAARKSELTSPETAAVHRLVQGAFQKVVVTGGQGLGESMVRHRSRLEIEKEQAVQQRKAEEAAQAQRAKRKVVHTPGSWSKQGLGELGKHKSRLEKEKEVAAAARKAGSGGSSPAAPKKLPSYMRPTSASKAMQVPKGLGEDVTKPKSRLEREKEAAAALRASSGSDPFRRSISNVKSKVAEAWQGQSLEGVMQKRKSKLELDKENAAAAANATSSSAAPQQQAKAPRKSFGFGSQGLGEMKVHKSKLQREQDAWAKAAAAEEAKFKPNLRKSIASIAMSKPAAVSTKTPSYMKSTQAHTTRTSLGGTADTDARFAA